MYIPIRRFRWIVSISATFLSKWIRQLIVSHRLLWARRLLNLRLLSDSGSCNRNNWNLFQLKRTLCLLRWCLHQMRHVWCLSKLFFKIHIQRQMHEGWKNSSSFFPIQGEENFMCVSMWLYLWTLIAGEERKKSQLILLHFETSIVLRLSTTFFFTRSLQHYDSRLSLKTKDFLYLLSLSSYFTFNYLLFLIERWTLFT